MYNLPNEKIVSFYKSLVTKSLTDAAIDIGLGERYTKEASIRSAGHKLYKSIVPEEYGIAPDVVELVKKSMEDRKQAGIRRDGLSVGPDGISGTITPVEKAELINPEDTKSVIVGGRNKAAMLLHKKMDRLANSRKLLDAVTLTQLATTFGIFFDKAQILTGQATENIQVMAKIRSDMTPEESLDALLNMREINDNRGE